MAPPTRMRSGDAAFDLPAREAVTIPAGERAVVPTGFAVAIPVGFAGLVVPRSGLARKQGLTVLNGPGLIDSGYRGEVAVILLNTSDEVVTVERGQRIAQMLVVAHSIAELEVVDELPPSEDGRGAAGWGSSG